MLTKENSIHLITFQSNADNEEDAGWEGEVAESLHPGHEVVPVEGGLECQPCSKVESLLVQYHDVQFMCICTKYKLHRI